MSHQNDSSPEAQVHITWRLPGEPTTGLYEYSGTRAAEGLCSACDERAIIFVDLPHRRFGRYTRGFCLDHLVRYRKRSGRP